MRTIGWNALIAGCLLMGNHENTKARDTDSTLQTSGWSQVWEEITESAPEDANIENWYELLAELAESPLALNSASREMLESIPFLTPEQVEGLLYYLYRYGPIRNLSELLLVEQMDETTLERLKPFVYPGEPAQSTSSWNWKEALRYGKQEIRLTAGRTLQQKAGFRTPADSGGYLGDAWASSLRYGFNYKNKLQWGLFLAKDAGEQWWKRGADYISAHFLLKRDGFLQTLLLGDYHLRFGQGLICGGSFSLGKQLSGGSPELPNSGPTRHFSGSENGFFRGVAATFRIIQPEGNEDWEVLLTPFASYRKLDASVAVDTFTTVSLTGLHRTLDERCKRSGVGEALGGIHADLRWRDLRMGLTTLGYCFNAVREPGSQLCNKFDFRGRKGNNHSIDLRWTGRKQRIYGELAMDGNWQWAGLLGWEARPLDVLSLILLARDFNPRFRSFDGKVFSEGGSPQNEQGIFVAGAWTGWANWEWAFSADMFKFPWLRYGANAPSSGEEWNLQATRHFGSTGAIFFRLRSKTWEQNSSSTTGLASVRKDQVRIRFVRKERAWEFRSQGDANRYTDENQPTYGWSIAQDVLFQHPQTGWSISYRCVLFDATSYPNRLYSWEKDLPGSFSMPMLYGQGLRHAMLLTKQWSPSFRTMLKIGHTVLDDVESSGTGMETSIGNARTEIRVLVRGTF